MDAVSLEKSAQSFRDLEDLTPTLRRDRCGWLLTLDLDKAILSAGPGRQDV